jgi:hypothetical protein
LNAATMKTKPTAYFLAAKTRALFAAALAGALLAAPLRSEDTGGWHTDASLDLFLAGLCGDVTVTGVPANVNQSFSDVLSSLDAALAGTVRFSNGQWSLATEFSYMKLGASTPVVTVDLKQWLVEPTVGYKISDGAEVFAGGRYTSIDVTATFQGPLGVVRGGRQVWWTPIVGAQFTLPLSSGNLDLVGHFDVGSGGGNNSTWQVYPYLNWRFSSTGSAHFVYRWLGTKYETGSGLTKFSYDLVVQGPQVSVAFRF